jgi:ferredoxin
MLDLQPAKTVSITYVDPDGEETTVNAEIGQNLLNVAHDNNVELEGTPHFAKS